MTLTSSRVWPFRHFGLKVLSLGLALLLWMVVAGEETVERGLRVPLELQQFPSGLELLGEPPSLVDVRVRGSSSVLGRMSPGDIVAVLDLRGARPGRRLFQMTPEQVRVPFGVQVVQVTPASLAMVFENAATGQVPVMPAVEGDPAPGYVMGRVTVDPPTVEIVGPESSVGQAKEALTETVSVAGARETITEEVTLGFVDQALRLKTPRLAVVTVQVLPGPQERTVRGRPVHLRNLSPNLTAQAVPSAVSVVLRGSREGIGRVVADDVIAFVDLAGLGAGDYSLSVGVDPSSEAGVSRINPATVQVRITSAKN